MQRIPEQGVRHVNVLNYTRVQKSKNIVGENSVTTRLHIRTKRNGAMEEHRNKTPETIRRTEHERNETTIG